MKKFIALVLALTLLLSLTALIGCDQKSPVAEPEGSQTPAQTPADAATDEEPESVQQVGEGEFKYADYSIGCIAPSLAIDYVAQICYDVADTMTAKGCEAQVVSAEGKDMEYVTLIENFRTQQVDLIFIMPQDPAYLEDAVAAARADGIMVVLMANPPEYEIDGALLSDYYDIGLLNIKLLMGWVEQNNPDAAPGSVPVALSYNAGSAAVAERARGYKDGIKENPVLKLAYTKEITAEQYSTEEGYKFAEEALLTDPEIRCFVVCDAVTTGIGVDSYISANPDFRTEEFCIVSVGSSPAVYELIDAAAKDPSASALRGVLAYGGNRPGLYVAKIVDVLLTGQESSPYYLNNVFYTRNSFSWTLPEGYNTDDSLFE